VLLQLGPVEEVVGQAGHALEAVASNELLESGAEVVELVPAMLNRLFLFLLLLLHILRHDERVLATAATLGRGRKAGEETSGIFEGHFRMQFWGRGHLLAGELLSGEEEDEELEEDNEQEEEEEQLDMTDVEREEVGGGSRPFL
jgi:hypothetical protein